MGIIEQIAFDVGQSWFGGMLIEPLRRYNEQRLEEQRTTLLSALSSGSIDIEEACKSDANIRMMYRYFSSLRDSASQRSQTFLAKIIAERIKISDFDESDFEKEVRLFSRITEKELVFLGEYVSFNKMAESEQLVLDVEGPQAIWLTMRKINIDKVVNAIEFDSISMALANLGLFAAVSAWGMIVFCPTELYFRVRRLLEPVFD